MSDRSGAHTRSAEQSAIEEAARRFAERPRAGRPIGKARPAAGPSQAPAEAAGSELRRVLTAQPGVVNSPALKGLFYLWVFFLIMEGALRKWFLPGLATPLLLVRDPIVIAMYAIAASRGVFPAGALPMATQILGALTLCTALMAERFIPFVAAYGWRSNFLYLPFIFLLPRFMTREDVLALGRWWLLAAIPMSFLLVAQFRQPPDAYINMGVGGSEAFTTMYGKVRTSGTFSFINGTVGFIGLSTVFFCYGLLRPKTYPFWLVLSSGVATGVSIAVSGSRSAVFVVTQILIGIMLAGLYQRRHFGPALRMAAVLAVIGLIVTRFDVAEEGLEVHAARFEVAAQQENPLLRLLYEFHVPMWMLRDAPPFGYGLGLGTNVGAAYTTGNVGFLLAENDWSRVFLEVGIFMGLPFVAMRIVIFLYLALQARRKLIEGEILPVILLASSSLTIMTGQLGQPTGLGFMVLTAGLVGAACNTGGPEPGLADSGRAPAGPLSRRGNAPTPAGGRPAPHRLRSGPPTRG